MSRRWTNADLCHLRRLASQGVDTCRIAEMLDRTVMAVRIKAAHQRIALTPPETRHGPVAVRPPFLEVRRR